MRERHHDLSPSTRFARSLTALLGAASTALLAACSSASHGTRPAAQRTPVTAAKSIAAWQIEAHRFGDYDDDDYNGSTDRDSDDSRATDHDGDADGGDYYDADDAPIRSFGRAAPTTAVRAISLVVHSYYADAARGDGAAACSLLEAPLAHTFPKELGLNGPSYLHGYLTCPSVMSRLFSLNRTRFTAYLAKLKITGVRTRHGQALAVLAFAGLPGRWLELEREGRSWKLSGLLDRELP